MAHTSICMIGVAVLACANGCSCLDNPNLGVLEPRIEVQTQELIFDDTWVGFTSERAVVLRNTGDAPGRASLRLTSTRFSIATSTDVTIAAGEKVLAHVIFAPPTAGAHLATIDVVGDAIESGLQRVSLTGRAVTVPSCDDENECTDDTFDLVSGVCTHVFHERECATENACLLDAQCGQGRCLGTFRACDTVSPCRTALCDVEVGCIEVDVAGACDTGDACVVGICTEGGCVTQPAPDLTPCGPFIPCVSAPICQAGACVDVVIPDGSPCSDGSLCTAADICEDGECVGTFVPGEPEVIHQELHLAGRRSWPTVRPDGSLLFYDPPGTFGVMWGGGMMRTLVATEGPIGVNWIVGTEAVAPSTSGLRGFGGNRHSEWLSVQLGGAVREFARMNSNGTIASFDIGDIVNEAVLLGDYAYGCPQNGEPRVAIFSMGTGVPVHASDISIEMECGRVVLDGDLETLAVKGVSVDGLHELKLFDLVDPLAPILIAETETEQGNFVDAAEGMLVVVQEDAQLGGTLQVYDSSDLTPLLRLLPPAGMTFAGPPTVADGFAYVRWGTEQFDVSALLYRRALSGAGTWQTIPQAGARIVLAPPVLRSRNVLVVPAYGEAATLLLEFDDGPHSELHALDVNHSRGGTLMWMADRLAMIGTDWVSTIDPTNVDTPIWDAIESMDTLRTPTIFRAEPEGSVGVFDPVNYQWRASSAYLNFGPDSVRTLNLDENLELTVGATAPPMVPPQFEPETPLQRSGASVNGHVAVVTIAGDAQLNPVPPGPLVFSLYDLAAAPTSPDEDWAPVSEFTLVDAGITQTSLVPIAASGTRVAVYAPPPSKTLFLIETALPSTPRVLATYTYPDLNRPSSLAVAGDSVLAVGSNAAHVFTRTGDVLASQTPGGFFGGTPINILSFDGRRALLSGNGSLLYYDFETSLMPSHNVDLGEKPLHAIEIESRLYVTTDHGLHVIYPPCPAP